MPLYAYGHLHRAIHLVEVLVARCRQNQLEQLRFKYTILEHKRKATTLVQISARLYHAAQIEVRYIHTRPSVNVCDNVLQHPITKGSCACAALAHDLTI